MVGFYRFDHYVNIMNDDRNQDKQPSKSNNSTIFAEAKQKRFAGYIRDINKEIKEYLRNGKFNILIKRCINYCRNSKKTIIGFIIISKSMLKKVSRTWLNKRIIN